MYKLLSLFLLSCLFTCNLFAAASFTVRVSFSIPERIEINKPCNNPQDKQNMQQIPAAIYNQQVIMRNNTPILMQTMLPK